MPGSDSDSFVFVAGLVVGGKNHTEMLGLVLADRNLNLRFLTARSHDARAVRFGVVNGHDDWSLVEVTVLYRSGPLSGQI